VIVSENQGEEAEHDDEHEDEDDLGKALFRLLPLQLYENHPTCQ
jgi:hypothetical protein